MDINHYSQWDLRFSEAAMTRALQAFHHLLRQTFRRAAGGHGQASAEGEKMRSSMGENIGENEGNIYGKFWGTHMGRVWIYIYINRTYGM